MTVIAVAPFVLKNALLSVAVDNYEKHIGSALFNPQVNDLTWKGIDGSVARDQGTPEWSLTIDYAQDWTTANSLSKYLLANVGQQKTLVFSPLGTGTGKPKFTIDAIIKPGPIGGKVHELQTASVTLVCSGQPVSGTW